MLSPPRLSRHGPCGRDGLAGYRQDAGVGLDQALRTEPGGLERDACHDDRLRRRSTHVHLPRCASPRVRKEASAEPKRSQFESRQPAARVKYELTTRTSNWQDCTADRRTILRLGHPLPALGQGLRALCHHPCRIAHGRLRLPHAQTSRTTDDKFITRSRRLPCWLDF